LAGGFLFGPLIATPAAVIGATAGATLSFVIARTSLGQIFQARTEGTLEKFREGFRKDSLNYLLFLRLVPLFPFQLVNLVAAFLNVPLRIFVFATLVGIIPGTAIDASVGGGLGAILNRGETPDLRLILEPEILLPLLALGFLSLAPIAYRRLKRP
jgi:uncharacterized membrane protein YdjX (TVP38/TMEM64 family)